ncbi:MAG: DUF445 family protein [Clostridiales bacterium]|jgi:uncharacterized membrane protein YheB (UPF0754 family)|nr:DUF445 family protein [Clostridiales bacterium]
MNIAVLITPVSGAVIGYFTNWLAIKMLFRPHEKKYLFGFPVPLTPGIIPKERFKLAAKVGDVVRDKVLTEDALHAAIETEEIRGKLDSFVDSFVDKIIADESFHEKVKNFVTTNASDFVLRAKTMFEESESAQNFIKDTLKKVIDANVNKLFSVFINYEKVYESVKTNVFEYVENNENVRVAAEKLSELSMSLSSEHVDRVKSEIKNLAEKALLKLGGQALTSLDFGKIVENKINAFAVEEAEEIIISVAKKELNAITVLGGVLGFVIGCVPLVMSLF